MQKTIKIDGKDVSLKASAKFLIIYNSQTNKDVLMSMMPLLDKVIDAISKGESSNITDAMHKVGGIELMDMFYVVWAMAKNADKTIPDADEWLDEFEEFPLDQILPEVFDLFVNTFVSKNFQKKTRQYVTNLMTEFKTIITSLSQNLSQAVSQEESQ